MSWLTELANAASAPASPPAVGGATKPASPPAAAPNFIQSMVRTDAESGETYLRLPVGEAQTQIIGRVLSAAADFIRGLKA